MSVASPRCLPVQGALVRSESLHAEIVSLITDLPGELCVTDDVGLNGANVVRIVTSDAIHAQLATTALAESRVGACLLDDEVHLLHEVANSLACGFRVATQDLVDLATQLPAMNRRQLEILELIAMGATNAEIAAQVNLSPSTLKRELRAIRSLAGCVDRLDLEMRVRGYFEDLQRPRSLFAFNSPMYGFKYDL